MCGNFFARGARRFSERQSYQPVGTKPCCVKGGDRQPKRLRAEALAAQAFDPSVSGEPADREKWSLVIQRGHKKEKVMKAMLRAMGMTVALALVLAVLAGRTWADDAKSPPTPEALLKALAEAGKPGAEHEKLQPFVGDWTFILRLWTDPSQPPA